LGAAFCLELAKKITHMFLYRRKRNNESVRNVLVGRAFNKQAQYLLLALR
jgi:hypothetical protein